jgi:REP element-mobilizing transposase RayT
MPDNLFRNKYRIPSARAVWHDYNGGAYFVTICTKDMAHFFGEIVDGEMCLTEIGRCADEQLRNVSSHYPYAKIPLWVVMPNHVHAIVMIDGDADLNGRDVARNVCTNGAEIRDLDVARNVSTDSGKNEIMAQQSPKCGTLAVVIRGMKSAVTKYANENGISFAWQTRFHDRIIRDCDEMNGIAQYIENNVAQWKSDEMNDE